MIKAKFVYPFLLSLLACFASCVQDEENSGSAGANGRILTINYSFDTPTTRVTANSLERKVENVAILFYGTDNAYVACQMVTDVPSGNGSFSVELPNAIQAGVEYKLIVIGNSFKHIYQISYF